jgi:hypothetical protein
MWNHSKIDCTVDLWMVMEIEKIFYKDILSAIVWFDLYLCYEKKTHPFQKTLQILQVKN